MENKNEKETSQFYLKRLLSILDANNITQQDFAKAINLNRNSIYKWQQSNRTPQWFLKAHKLTNFLNSIDGVNSILFFDPDFDPNKINEYNNKIEDLEKKIQSLNRNIEKLEEQKRSLQQRDFLGIDRELVSNIKNAEETKHVDSNYYNRKLILARELYEEFVKVLNNK